MKILDRLVEMVRVVHGLAGKVAKFTSPLTLCPVTFESFSGGAARSIPPIVRRQDRCQWLRSFQPSSLKGSLVVGAPRSFIHRALVVHAEVDDGKHQHGGNSGERIGCAELTIAAARAQVSGKLVMAR